jgi:hypothetical protein
VNFFNLPTPTVLLGSIGLAAALIYFPYILVAIGRFQVGFDMGALQNEPTGRTRTPSRPSLPLLPLL